ncbi:phage portal protein [Streptomyces sp. DW26H14]|uniref:phage portal protein n=1 Tax=Streptomyces sp. DW26H14 TaxID=3435395 RepID=UPI00403DF5D2
MRNPFRGLFRRTDAPTEKRDIGIGDASWPVAGFSSPGAESLHGALRLGPVFAAGRLLSTSIASMPLHVYRTVGERKQRLPLPSLFTSPSATGELHDWVQRAVLSLVYRGNAVGVVTQRDYLEYPTQIEWLDPASVWVQDTMPMGQRGSYTDPVWTYCGVELPNEDVVHIPWFPLPGRVWGLPPLMAYATTVSTNLAAQKFSDDWFQSGGVPPGTFANAAQTVEQEAAAVIKRRLVQAIRSHEPIVYGKDWTYTPITVSPAEAQFVQTLNLGATQIAAIYGIPPEMIGGETGGSMSYSSPEQREIELIQFGLLPYLTKLEAHLSALLPRGQSARFDADAMIRTDIATRWSVYEKQRLIGARNIDEIRGDENLPPLPNGKGEDYTPLPIQAGVAVTPPTVRSDDEGRLRLIRSEEKDHG